MAIQTTPREVSRVGGSTSLADVIDRILDKGLVIDAWISISIVGLEILTIEARVVVASVDTYLRYANAISEMGLVSAPKRLFAPEPQPRGVEPLPEQRQLPSPQELQHYLEDHGEGMTLEDLAEHFGATREAMAERLHRLESEGSVMQQERS
jgi:hypothetical protein